MARRRPLVASSGQPVELPVGDRLTGTWAKAIPVASGGAVSTTIPAGIFQNLPVIKHTIQAAGTRDYVFRISALTMDATTKVITIAGVVRESKLLPASILNLLALQGYDTFQATTTAVTLHLSAEESD